MYIQLQNLKLINFTTLKGTGSDKSLINVEIFFSKVSKRDINHNSLEWERSLY